MHSFQNILIPTDFSQAAWNAVQMGLALADKKQSKLILLHVFPSAAKFGADKKTSREDEQLLKSLQKQMDEFCLSLQKNSTVTIIPVILEGKVEKEILGYVEHNEFDVVILGVNSNGSDNLPGSHISQIIEHANAPVMVIPNHILSQEKISA